MQAIKDYLIKEKGFKEEELRAAKNYLQFIPEELRVTTKKPIHFEFYANHIRLHIEAPFNENQFNDSRKLVKKQFNEKKESVNYEFEKWVGAENCCCKMKEQVSNWDEIAECFRQIQADFKDINFKQLFMKNANIQNYINLLESNHNLIFHGAPGTGKTFTAKQMAMQMIFGKVFDENEMTAEQKKQFEEQCGFVQFHPSYDYTDFVEGLRPVENATEGDVSGFKRQDGVFKAFCKKAAKNMVDSQKTPEEELSVELNAEEKLGDFLDKAIEKRTEYFTIKGSKFFIESVDEKTININILVKNVTKKLRLNKNEILALLKSDQNFNKVKDLKSFFGAKIATQSFSYDYAIWKNVTESYGEKITENEDYEESIKTDAQVWKVSLMRTGDNPIRTDCLENGYIRIGWQGYGNVDFNNYEDYTDGGSGILKKFQKEMQIGDIVISCFSDKETDAIGIIVGDYEYRKEGGEYPRYRKVKWLVKGIKENIVALNNNKKMTLSTIHKLNITPSQIKCILKKYTIISTEVPTKTTEKLPFIFLIDEINRGETSKIFGELFFSLDPGYRGEKGRLNTQYQNLVPEGDVFKKGFYIPENVYVIGTMNDIDRSVESMDFAFRRRFAWKELKVEDTQSMLDSLELPQEIIAEAKVKMDALNEKIRKNDDLGESYQIGAAYFMKLKNYDGNFQQLWNYHLRGLLVEYLRGTGNEKELLTAFEKVYLGE